MWRNQSNANGHFASFSSVRTPGATVTQDPTTPTSGFYRSVAINTFGITTDKVVSAGMGNTGLQPENLAGPGKETVGAPAAPLGGGPSAPDPGRRSSPAAPLQPVVEPAQLPADGASPDRGPGRRRPGVRRDTTPVLTGRSGRTPVA